MVYVLTLFSLENFTPECMQALVRVLQAKNIFSLNLGEAGKNLQKVHYEQLLRHLRTPAGPYSPLPASLPAALPAAFPSVLPAAHHASLHAQPRLPPCTRCAARHNLPVRWGRLPHRGTAEVKGFDRQGPATSDRERGKAAVESRAS